MQLRILLHPAPGASNSSKPTVCHLRESVHNRLWEGMEQQRVYCRPICCCCQRGRCCCRCLSRLFCVVYCCLLPLLRCCWSCYCSCCALWKCKARVQLYVASCDEEQHACQHQQHAKLHHRPYLRPFFIVVAAAAAGADAAAWGCAAWQLLLLSALAAAGDDEGSVALHV